MKNLSRVFALVAMLVAPWAPAATAQQKAETVRPGLLAAGGYLDHPDPDIVLSLGAGVFYRTAYPGSADMRLGPSILFLPDYIRFKNGFEFGSGQSVGFREGIGLRGSYRFISDRNAQDYPELNGLNDLDWSSEFGLGIGYEKQSYRLFGDVRYGVIGHNAWVGQLGADVIARPVAGLTLTLGPRFDYGDDKFMGTYFGVTGAESVASSFAAHNPTGGLVSAGVEFGAIYQIDQRWGLRGKIVWNQYQGDAARSSITQYGSADAYNIQLMLTRRFSINF